MQAALEVEERKNVKLEGRVEELEAKCRSRDQEIEDLRRALVDSRLATVAAKDKAVEFQLKVNEAKEQTAKVEEARIQDQRDA